MAGLVNKVIGGFKVLEEIKGGSGSQGSVCRAVCEKQAFPSVPVGTVVALKTMPVNDEEGKIFAKLRKRTDQLAKLRHPNVVRYHGCFSEQGLFSEIHVIVLDFLDGETLHQRLARCPGGLDVDEALRICDAALAGLEYTSRAGIVHRDVKPGNIFLCKDGTVRLIDFEIALREGGTVTSATSNFAGSFDYMSPDFTNARFRGNVGSDIFSMGVVLHEMLTGKTPYQRFEGDDKQANFAFLQRWARVAEGVSPIRISSRVRRLVAHADEVLGKALAIVPAQRYADFTAFRAGLKAIRFRDLRNGDKVYRMLQLVGKGGFGEVFKARDRHTGQAVAIKHLLKAAYAERFYREAKIMAQLRDPCFVQFIDFFVIENGSAREAFLVMDYLEGMPGSSLRDAIHRRAGEGMPVHDVLCAFARFAHGLHVMHRRGIYHRDIKPSNLYYPENHLADAAIMDLGIARDVHGTATTGQVPGTLDYMPPEVVMESNRGDAGMDIYALGLCLYEALTGKLGYPRLPTGPTALAMFFARAKEMQAPRLDDPIVVRDDELAELIAHMTQPHANKRLKDAVELERVLLSIAKRYRPVDAPAPICEPEATVEESATLAVAFQPSPASPAGDGKENAVPGETQIMPEGNTLATRIVDATAATAPANGKMSALLREKEALDRRRRGNAAAVYKKIAVFFAVLLGILGVGVLLRGPINGLAANLVAEKAAREADEALDAWMQSETAGRGKDAAWYAKWNPAFSSWPRLTLNMWTAHSNRLAQGWIATDENRRSFLLAADERDALARAYADSSVEKAETDDKVEAWEAKWSFLRRRMPERWNRLKSSIGDAAVAREKLEARKTHSREERRILVKCREDLKAIERLAAQDVKDWRGKLEQVNAEFNEQVKLGKVSESVRNEIGHEIDSRRKWIVGAVENGTDVQITAAGRAIDPHKSDVLIFKDGFPLNAQIVASGCEPVRQLSEKEFDAQVIVVRAADLRARPGVVVVPSLEADVSCTIDGKDVRPGELKTSAGNHVLKYANRRATYDGQSDFSDQVTNFQVKADERVVLRGPVEWKQTPDFSKRAKNAQLAKEGRELDAAIRKLLSVEPIEDRRGRLSRGRARLDDEQVVLKLAAFDPAAPKRLNELHAREVKRVVGQVKNETAVEVRIKVYEDDVVVAPGTTKRVDFDQGWPSAPLFASAPGYEPVPLPLEPSAFDGKTFTVEAKHLTPSAVAVKIPDLESDVKLLLDGQVRTGSMAKLKPGSHVAEYARPDCVRQKLPFEVKTGEERTMPAPGIWQQTEDAKKFAQAQAKFAAGNYNEAKRLLAEIGRLESAATQRKLDEIKTKVSNYEGLLQIVEEAKEYQSSGDWSMVIARYAKAHEGGYSLLPEDVKRLRESFENYKQMISRRREAKKKSRKDNAQTQITQMEAELQKVQELYDAALGR